MLIRIENKRADALPRKPPEYVRLLNGPNHCLEKAVTASFRKKRKRAGLSARLASFLWWMTKFTGSLRESAPRLYTGEWLVKVLGSYAQSDRHI